MTARETARVAATVASVLGAGREVFVAPGSRSAPLALAFEKVPQCRVHVVLNERAAAFLALGAGRATGRPAIALCTSGSAGCHFYPAVAEASLGRVPLIVMTADRPGELHGCGAPQTMPQRGMFGGFVRHSLCLPEPCHDVGGRWLRNAAAQALAASLGSPPGPVHVNAPFREPLWDPAVSSAGDDLVAPDVTRATSRLPADRLGRLAAELAQAPRGLMVCGPIAPATIGSEELADAVANLAAVLRWPIIADVLSGTRFGRHEQRGIVAPIDALLGETATLAEPALVLQFGQLPTSKALCSWLQRHADRMLLVDPDGAWQDGGGVAHRMVCADPVALCRDLHAQLVHHVVNNETARFTDAWLTAGAQTRAGLASHVAEGEWEGRVAHAVAAAVPDGGLLFAANSLPVRDLDRFAEPSRRRVAVLANRGVNGIDGCIASAAGAAIARGGPAIAILGDLAFLHDLDGFEAASRLVPDSGARLTIVVVDNGGGGIFGELAVAAHPSFERLFLAPRPCDLDRLCGAFGVSYLRAAASELPRALAAEAERPGLRVVHVAIDRADSSARRRRALQAVRESLNNSSASTRYP